MPDKSANTLPITDASPLAQLLAIGNKAQVLATVLSRGDATQASLQSAMITVTDLLISLATVVVVVYGEQQLAMRRSMESI